MNLDVFWDDGAPFDILTGRHDPTFAIVAPPRGAVVRITSVQPVAEWEKLAAILYRNDLYDFHNMGDFYMDMTDPDLVWPQQSLRDYLLSSAAALSKERLGEPDPYDDFVLSRALLDDRPNWQKANAPSRTVRKQNGLMVKSISTAAVLG